MQETKQTRGMFLVRALQRIIAHKEIKRSQNAAVKKACVAALDDIKADLEHIGDAEAVAKSLHTLIEADKYFIAFEMSCQTKVPAVVSISLDCLQKMIAYGILVGNAPDSNNQGKRLIDRVVDTICSCFIGTATDENVQLQIIKALLTAVTSTNCEIHEGTVLQAVRTCYNIYLASKNLVNQTTAKATLTQMLSVIFSRMEIQATIEEKQLQELQESMEQAKLHEQTNGVASDEDDEKLANQNEAPESEQHHQVTVKEEAKVTEESSADGKDDVQIESEVKQIIDEIITKVTMETGGDETTNETAESVNGDQSFQADFSQFNGSATPTSSAPSQLEELEITQSYLQILKKDAFLVFRSLCKLSMKPLSEGAPDAKSHEHRSKVLSLHLLLSIMQSSGPVFRTSEMFINAIKQYLCVSLSKNGVSTVGEVFELSLSIFLKLLENFKTHLKMQIQVFFKEIFLNILESSSSSFDHKWMVLHTLSKICDDAQCIVDIYVNYDCDINAANIYERLINHLSRISQHHIQHNASFTSAQDQALRKKSLECLVSILKCMVEWSKDLYVDPHSLSNLGKTNNPDTGLANGQLQVTSAGSERSLHSDTSSDVINVESTQTESTDNLVSYDNPETIEGIKQQKDVLEQGITLFNKKPKKGIQFLQAKEMVGTSAESVAEFLSHEDRLAPAQIGEYLGENESYNKEVMYAYVDRLNFHRMDFVSAIRYFLEGFRLPGEAQKIDRLMEKFASRYCDCNPKTSVFSSADVAYVLAYSVIILTTDLHSQQVKRKISKEDYIKMNRGINDSKDLPRDYLEDIYDQIETQEITLRKTKTEKVETTKGAIMTEKQRKQEMSHMADTAKALMEAVSHVQSSFIQTKHYDHVKPMFKLAWRSVLVAFSVCLQDSDDTGITMLCLEGMRCAIRIACIFQLRLERDTFVQALSRFSLLQATAGIQEMKTKNIETIKTLITVAITDGNYLQDSWLEILKCISQLELLQLIGSGVRDQTAVAMKSARSGSTVDSNPILTKTFGLEHKKLASIQESMGETSSQNVVVAVDRIFTGSTRLDGDAIVDFVRWLSSVSLDELHNPSQPRMFSLQKIVEISYYNMGRIRIQWSRIWAILGTYFNTVGCIDDQDIAFFAVDSLRQLSMKFLEMGELPGYSFQKDFLRPFEHIMKHNVSPVIQDMAVRCIVQMVNSQVQNIKSGWKNIFSVFTLAAAHSDENIVELAFQTITNIITHLFEQYFSTMIPCFQDIISALREFSCCPFPDISMESIRLIRLCADYVAIRPQLFEFEASSTDESGDACNDQVWVRGWFPIFFELSCVISRCKLDVRTRGLTVMFEIMKTYGDKFTPTWWDDLFQIIFRIFDQMKIPQQHIEKTDWFATTCNHALFAVCDVFTQYYSILAPTLVPSVYMQLLWCINQDNEQLARSGVNCIENLILSNGHKFTEELWVTTTDTLEKVFQNVSANRLMTWDPTVNDVSELQKEQLNCVLTAEMIECIDRILFYPSVSRKDDEHNITLAQNPSMQLLPSEVHEHEMFGRFAHRQHLRIVDCLLRAHDFAKQFNTNNEQRTVLWKAGFKGKSKPNLIRQETTSLSCALRMMFRLQQINQQDTKDVLLRECNRLFSYFKSLNSESHREVWTPVLLLCFVQMLQLPDNEFKVFSRHLHNSICDLLILELKPEIRFIMRRYFIKQGDTSH